MSRSKRVQPQSQLPCSTDEAPMPNGRGSERTSAIHYTVEPGWLQLPSALANADVTDVTVDGEDRVYVLTRHLHAF